MDIAQWYETTASDCESGLALRAIVIPAGSMAPYVQADLVGWASVLGMEGVARLDSSAELIAVLASLLKPGDEAARTLARAAVHELQMPFVTEELRGAPLCAVADTADAPFSAVVSLAATAEVQLVLIAVPAGVTVLGSAPAVAVALADGLSERIREVMGLDGRATAEEVTPEDV